MTSNAPDYVLPSTKANDICTPVQKYKKGCCNIVAANSQRRNNVAPTSPRSHDDVSTSDQCCYVAEIGHVLVINHNLPFVIVAL